MFRSHKHKTVKSGERFDFKFSNFHALQVPKGWDKLSVSIVLAETGKVITKTQKEAVRYGHCRWTETLSESIWVSQDTELEECPLKFVLSMGSTRSAILGEATINLAGYICSKAPIPVSLLLENCNRGTIFQVNIQCLTPRLRFRDERWKGASLFLEDVNAVYGDIENQSDASDCTFTRSIESSSSNYVDSTSYLEELGSRDTSFSAGGSFISSDAMEGFLSREKFPSGYPLTGIISNQARKQDSMGSCGSRPKDRCALDYCHKSYNSSSNSIIGLFGAHSEKQRLDCGQILHAISTSPLRSSVSSKDFLEAADITIEDICAQATMWQRNARTLMHDLDVLKKEFFNQSKELENLDIELSKAHAERDDLVKEINRLKLLLDQLADKQTALEIVPPPDTTHFQKALQEEMKFQKNSNASLVLQLKKAEELNQELVSVLQGLEATIERQKIEIRTLTQKLESIESERRVESSVTKVLAEKTQKSSCNLKLEGNTVAEPAVKLQELFEPEDGENIKIQLQQLQEAKRSLETTVQLLEKNLEERDEEIQLERDLKVQSLLDCEAKWRSQLAATEEEVSNLKATVSKSISTNSSDFSNRGEYNLMEEIKALKEKVQELEKDCDELTDQNLELVFKLNESTRDLIKCSASFSSGSDELSANDSTNSSMTELNKINSPAALEMSRICSELLKQIQSYLAHVKKLERTKNSPLSKESQYGLCSSESQRKKALGILNKLLQLNKLFKAKISDCEDELHLFKEETKRNFDQVHNKLDGNYLKEKRSSNDCGLNICSIEQEVEVTDQSKALLAKISKIREIKGKLLQKEEEIEAQRHCQRRLENQISDLQQEKSQLEKNMDMMLRESSVTSKCICDLRNDMMVLSSSMDFQISANRSLERRSAELESSKLELELHLSEIEEENVQLSERISGLEAQLRYLTDERESNRLELHNAESLGMNLQDEVKRLETEMKGQKLNLRQKLQEVNNSWVEAQEECHCLRRASQKLEAMVETLMGESTSLQKMNGELRKQNMDLHRQCMFLEAELGELHESFSCCSRKVEALEASFSSILVEFDSTEKNFAAKLENLLLENRKQREKIVLEESLLNQMYLEKSGEVENLKREIAYLTLQMSATDDERERFASEAVLEMYTLRADKAQLQTTLEEVHMKFKSTENELRALQLEYEKKVQELVSELAASKQNQQLLMADLEKLLGLLEKIRSNEERLKGNCHELDLKLKFAAYERQTLAEEIIILRDQLQKITLLQQEVLNLNNSLCEASFEKERLEASLESLTADYEELKAEKVSLTRKVSSMQQAAYDSEGLRHSKVALEEKVLRLEGDLIAKEALFAKDAEMKNELSRTKRANNQFQRKIKHLEDEKEEYRKKAQALEEVIKQKNEVQQEDFESCTRVLTMCTKLNAAVIFPHDKLKVSEEEKSSIQLCQKLSAESDHTKHNGLENLHTSPNKRKDDDSDCWDFRSSQITRIDPKSKIQLLENKLVEAWEASDVYKGQLESCRKHLDLFSVSLHKRNCDL